MKYIRGFGTYVPGGQRMRRRQLLFVAGCCIIPSKKAAGDIPDIFADLGKAMSGSSGAAGENLSRCCPRAARCMRLPA